MTIRFTHNTEIRLSSADLTERTLIGQVFERAEMEVEDIVYPGATVEGNDHWFRDANGWYYWSGFAVPVIPVIPATGVQNGNGSALNGTVPTITPPLTEEPTVLAVLQESDNAGFDESGELMPFGETRLPAEDAIDFTTLGMIDLPEGMEEVREVHAPTAEPDPVSAKFNDIPLNWGIELLDIRHQYWTGRRSRGKGTSIALLGTGVAPNCSDIEISGAFIVQGLGDDITDLDGMGTQAAIIAAGRGRVHCGVAPEASLLIGKIGALHHTITPKAVLDGLDWAIDSQADVIVILTNFARLDLSAERLLQQKIASAVSANIVVIVPAGHASDYYTGPQYPSAFPEVLSVGSCNELGQKSSFSTKNGKIDILAPGESMEVVGYDGVTLVPSLPDTAISASFAAGCIALMINDYRNKNQSFSAAQIVEDLKTAAFNKQKYGVHDRETGTGYGLFRFPG